MSKEFVDEIVKSHKVVIFSKSKCPCSKKALTTLESVHIKPEALHWVAIDERQDTSEIQDYLGISVSGISMTWTLTGARTVPRVFINGKFFGGGDATVEASQNGELVKLLKEAGAI